MAKPSKNELELLGSINEIKAQLTSLDKKIDTLISRSTSETKAFPKPVVNHAPAHNNPNDRNKGKIMYAAVCADCQKECSVPFKPSGDRPIYCQDCFSRRKVISLSKITVHEKPKEIIPAQTPAPKEAAAKSRVKTKKKAVAVKKPVAKKKSTPKKK